jgi:atypical dual specificity phosphatase
MSAQKAIEMVRKERPGSIQSTSQEIAVSSYEKFLKSRQ